MPKRAYNAKQDTSYTKSDLPIYTKKPYFAA